MVFKRKRRLRFFGTNQRIGSKNGFQATEDHRNQVFRLLTTVFAFPGSAVEVSGRVSQRRGAFSQRGIVDDKDEYRFTVTVEQTMNDSDGQEKR